MELFPDLDTVFGSSYNRFWFVLDKPFIFQNMKRINNITGGCIMDRYYEALYTSIGIYTCREKKTANNHLFKSCS